MHLLKHKSFHVHSAANVERVRRDEVEAQRVAAEKRAATLAADREARVETLRARIRGDHPPPLAPRPPSPTADAPASSTSRDRFHLFPEPTSRPRDRRDRRDRDRRDRRDRDRDRDRLASRKPSANDESHRLGGSRHSTARAPWYTAPQGIPKLDEDAPSSRGRCEWDDPIYGMGIKGVKRSLKAKPYRARPRSRSRSRSPPAVAKRELIKSAELPSFDELRQRRLQREQAERARMRDLYSVTRRD
ncbi:hypothetical protein H9P43_001869 [Blastocladiella emersonii ATCC 22665]|nr:hypothetical protein H9P43_001869 [Blastocladiella emersonii ATCC 22665]